MDDVTTPSSVRRELNLKFDALSIFKRDRASALYHFCVAVEMSTNPYTVDPDLVMAMGRRVLEASMRAIPGIYRNCPAVSAAPMVQFNLAAFAEAMELVEFAFRYDQIMYCFELADRGQFEVRYDPLEQHTIFFYASDDESAADTLLRSHERDSNIELATEADKAVIFEIAQEAKRELEQTILFVDPDAISYPYSCSESRGQEMGKGAHNRPEMGVSGGPRCPSTTLLRSIPCRKYRAPPRAAGL